MNEKFLQCFPNAPQATVDEVITWQREQAENERAWRIEKERRRTALRSFAAEAERQLHDPHQIRKHPDRLLWRAAKGLKFFKLQYGLEDTLTKKEKRIKKKLIRRSERFLRQFCGDETGGEIPAKSAVTKTAALARVVAAV